MGIIITNFVFYF